MRPIDANSGEIPLIPNPRNALNGQCFGSQAAVDQRQHRSPKGIHWKQICDGKRWKCINKPVESTEPEEQVCFRSEIYNLTDAACKKIWPSAFFWRGMEAALRNGVPF